MKNRILNVFLIIVNIVVINVFLVQYTNASYPMVGLDYWGWTTQLLDSHLYYKANGLSIEWYSPNFGGGLPAYPDPAQMQFSLPQLVTWFINPYPAALVSMAIYIAIGFIVTYLFLHKILEFKPLSAILGADFFLINGFLIERVVIGHINFLTFPLIIIPIYALLNPKLPAWVAGALISITGAALVYSSGVYIAVIGLFSALMIFPLVYFLKPGLFLWCKILPALIWGGILTALLCGSKLYATAEYMRFFPRTEHEHFPVNWITGLKGMIFQLVGTLNFLPILAFIHKTSASFTVRLIEWTKTPYGFWELDSSIAPGLMILLVVGVLMALFRKPHIKTIRVPIWKIIAGICLILAISLATEFSIAKGILYDQLGTLPVLQSLHAETRFTASFILPLAIVGAFIFDVFTSKWKFAIRIFLAFALLSGISLASMWSYFSMPLNTQVRYFDITSIYKTYQLSSAGKSFPVHQIVPDMNDYEVFLAGASNVSHHHNALFGDTDALLTPLVHAGSVFDEQDGYFNMTDPSGLVFPEVNGSKFFERIPVSDYKKLVDFVNRRPSDWKLPIIQIILDWAAGITLLLETCAFLVYLGVKRIPFLNSLHFPQLRQRNP